MSLHCSAPLGLFLKGEVVVVFCFFEWWGRRVCGVVGDSRGVLGCGDVSVCVLLRMQPQRVGPPEGGEAAAPPGAPSVSASGTEP